MNGVAFPGWDRLRHGGLLLDPARLRQLASAEPVPLPTHLEQEFRRRAGALADGGTGAADFAVFVLKRVCGFDRGDGTWLLGPSVGAEWSRRAVTGEAVRPRALWRGLRGAILPMFFDAEPRLGVGRGRRAVSGALQWLRAGSERLALLTNGRQWRLLFAGLDFDAWCEWDADLWFEEGAVAPPVQALRTLVQPDLWTPPAPGEPAPLLAAILESRKGQAELSAVLGERVREAVEVLVQAHGEALRARGDGLDPADIYRAAVRVVMRLVVVLFAESRELLPRDNALYHGAYGLSGLLEELERGAARGGGRLARSWSAWPRLLALARLVHGGSHHPALPVPAYGGELFAPGDPDAADGVSRALHVFETACFEREALPDRDVLRLLTLITRTRVKIRQGRASTWVPAPVDFSDLSSEYIGILYEGLLDFELKTAPAGDPVVFLAVGSQPALPLSRLEAMEGRALKELFEKLKDTSSGDEESEESGADADAEAGDDETAEGTGEDAADEAAAEEPAGDEAEPAAGPAADAGDVRHATRTRAETWARRAVEAAGLVRRPRSRLTPERQLAQEAALARKARQLVSRVVLPGEWYLVRWGGTRKGAGTFYTRPGLAVPTVHRTLRPLAYAPPAGEGGAPDADTPPSAWVPRPPEEILALAVCDPACGSGSFLVAALRFLTEALYRSLFHHGRIRADGERAVARLLAGGGAGGESLGEELLPCPPDDPAFESRFKAVLRRHVVERCLYGVDLDPVAVELCRLALWVETMDRTLPFSFLDHKVRCGNSLVGAWFDQFPHYPVMAWKNREGGDKNHTHGVHFEQEARTKAIKEFVKKVLAPDLVAAITGQKALPGLAPAAVAAAHSDLRGLLARLHELPVHDSAERARLYREELLGSPAYRALKDALDLWCACWFWPADALDRAPLPTAFAAPPEATRAVARRVAAAKRFFHWELEFPDVFQSPGSGFDAILGNPPWDTAKPNSKEFFSNIDPLYRSYGKQEALRYQSGYFQNAEVERAWLDYNADFRAQSNFVGSVAAAFGDPSAEVAGADRFSISRSPKTNADLHDRWRSERAGSRGFADRRHPFRHQGSADLNLYKLFLEQAHALLRDGGRLGLIVPSGLYSDHGTGALRKLFLDECRWEWLFGFENRDKVFEIDSRFKFNPVIVQKGGRTEAVRTAFMRRRLEDWEHAEGLATPYSRAQVARFSPRSLAILEIQSARDLDVLEKIYANSVLLGDEGPDGWGVKYSREFDMTNDSKLFPPRPWWEERGYRPDEYSRWLKGDWRPIAELWAELGVDPARPRPVEVELDEWLFETGISPEERAARAQFVHGHWLKPGDVQRTEWKLRCAQPPYDTLPIPRTDIPAGIILSRAADAWIREDRIEDTALPLYEGRMIGQFDFSQKGWVSGKGRGAIWCEIPWESKQINPQYLMANKDYLNYSPCSWFPKLSHMRVGSATNERSAVGCAVVGAPTGDTAAIFYKESWTFTSCLSGIINSFVFDFITRRRLVGLHLDYHVFAQNPIPRLWDTELSIDYQINTQLLSSSVAQTMNWFYRLSINPCSESWRKRWATKSHERLRLRSMSDAIVLKHYGLGLPDASHILIECDLPRGVASPSRNDPKGFWRIDKELDPEQRHTVLALIACDDLEEKIHAADGDCEKGIKAFLNQNDGEGWMIPETLCLADYGLGHDERAKHPQPVASRLGPRFYDWQLVQTAEESWAECHRHARNLLGEEGYRRLLEEIRNPSSCGAEEENPVGRPEAREVAEPPSPYGQRKLFD